tara:strand:+ start:2451 stop:3320 length:870 start_codon:yes stop_codon:yes gene_type:complete
MIKIQTINEFSLGQDIYGFYQSIFKEKKLTKNGDYFIDVQLRDKTGQINGKIWKFCDFYENMFEEGDLVAVKAIVKSYRKNFFLEILNINQLDSSKYIKYGFDEKNILPSISASSDIIYKNILKEISKLDKPYKDFLHHIYTQYENEIKNYPDLLTYSNYGQKGSLILKIYNALRIAKLIYNNKTLKDKDIIISAILLKYIGRVKQYKYNIIFSLSDVSKNENCFILSRDIIKKYSKKNQSISREDIIELTDIVLYDGVNHDIENPKAMIVSDIFNLEKSISNNQQDDE